MGPAFPAVGAVDCSGQGAQASDSPTGRTKDPESYIGRSRCETLQVHVVSPDQLMNVLVSLYLKEEEKNDQGENKKWAI